MTFSLDLRNEEATLDIAHLLALALDSCAQYKALIFLEGQLGAGKTTFSRGIIRAMGHQGAVKSPTFTLVEPYITDKGQVYHFDLYRLSEPEELEYLGIDDYFDGGQLVLVEWAERGEGFLPSCDLRISLSVVGAGRRIDIEPNSVAGERICSYLMSHSVDERM